MNEREAPAADESAHPSGPVSRRSVLRAAAVVGGALVLGEGLVRSDPSGAPLGSLPAGANEPFTRPLRFPTVLTGESIRLVAQPADVPLLPGRKTRMWTFNGEFPGPTIRRVSGRRTRVTVEHRLPRSADSLTIHHHGGHQPSSEDGQPERHVIAPGKARTYTYDLREDGAPERGAMQWYHDHSHGRTTRNVWRGLAGMVILDDPAEVRLGLPRGEFDLPMMIGDRSFDENNQLVDPVMGTPPFDDVFGEHLLVNGVPEPYLDVAPRRYRLRLLNASVFRIYNLALSDGSAFLQVGTESGLLPAPVRRTQVLLGPGERVDLVVDFAGKRGKEIDLKSVAASGTSYVPRTTPAIAPLLRFRVRKAAREDSRVPAKLRPLPKWAAGLSTTPDRIWSFGNGLDPKGGTAWTINGLAFDHHRVDARPALGSTETWMLVNTSPTTMSHYIHIHDVDWVVLSRNGAPPAPDEAGLKETFRLDPGEVVVIGSKFTDHLGPYMLHCHMLQHEDHGMMTTFEVVKPEQADLAGSTPSLEAALARDIPDPAVRQHVRAVIDGARNGKPARVPAAPAVAVPGSGAHH